MPYPSSRGYSVSEQGSQLMIQGFFSRLLADLHLLPFFLISWCKFHLVVVCLFSYVQLFWTPWTAACQASLSFTISWSLLKLMSIESLMPSNHLILCHPPLLPPSIFRTSGSFPMSQFFPSSGQSTGVSASASVLPMNIQGQFSLGLLV